MDRPRSMRIALVTDAWHPQTNGVVKTLSTTAHMLERLGHRVLVVEPSAFRTFGCPTYPEIRLAWLPFRKLSQLLEDFEPDAIHIATEGTLGTAGRKWCLKHSLPFTTSYHTQFPEYVRARAPVPVSLSYAYLRRFHAAAARTMVATPSMQRQLESRGFSNLVRWSRGVDIELFRPRDKDYLNFKTPLFIYVGRVAVEKSIEDFLKLKLPGTKIVVGDGPERAALQARYPQVVFTGYQYGEELARCLASADVFVFPSRTDTFGLVLLEAMASGVPVAAYPVQGPIDVIRAGVSGILDEDLEAAALRALSLRPADCRDHSLTYTWEAATAQFASNLAPVRVSAAEATLSIGPAVNLWSARVPGANPVGAKESVH